MKEKLRFFNVLKMKYFILGLLIATSYSHSYGGNDLTSLSDVYQQKKITVSGKVTDKDGVPLAGVSIIVKDNPSKGVSTNFDGDYSIIVEKGDVLVFSYLGFTTQEISTAGRVLMGGGKTMKINVLMKEDAQQLDDVVVTAYGTGQKKVSVVGSIQTIKPAELKVPSSNLSSGFAGRMAGVIAVQRSGQPGADGASFWVRGISTLSGATNPLIILDGVQVSAGDLNALDPEVIESFSILKDATATALYGSRGANGVMIITTKSGADLKKPIINVRLETNISAPTSKPNFVDGVTYMKLYNEGVKNLSSNVLPYTQEKIDGTAQGLDPYIFPNVNWYDEIFEPFAFNQKANLNIRGGGRKLNYFMSGSVNHDTGMIKNISRDYFSFNNNIDVMRYAFQNNINLNLSETSKISLKINSQFIDKRDPRVSVGGTFSKIMNINPVDFPILYPNEQGTDIVMWGAYEGAGSESATGTNPISNLVSGYSDTFQSTVIANLSFNQKLDFLLEGLKFSAMTSFKNWSSTTSNRVSHINSFSLTNYSKNPDSTYNYVISPIGQEQPVVLNTNGSTMGDRRIYLQAFLDYSKTFNEVHDFNALFVYNQEETALNNIAANESFGRLLNSLPRRRQGFAGRLSYAYDDRYLVEFNAGYNGSENFAKGKRFGFFPSIALGYNVSEEVYFKPLKDIITWLKIRGSWGLVGNDNTGSGRFAYMSNIDLHGKGFLTGLNQNYYQSGPVYRRYPNPNLTWEIGKKTNIGFDLQMWGKLNITFDVFKEIRSNIFQERISIPDYLGTAGTKIFGNLAKVRNWGIDGSIDYNGKISENWYASVKGTFTFARNKVLEYDQAPFQKYPQLSIIGQRLHTHLGYIAERLFIDQAEIDASPDQQISGNMGPGDIKYKNMPDFEGNYDDIINPDDRSYIGDPTIPEIVYGLGANFKYKNLDFGFFFQGVANTSLMMSNFHPFGTQKRRNVLKFIADNHWSPTNQNIYATYPRLTHDDHANNTVGSTFWLRDASFLKLKNVEVGFTIPKYENIRFYVTATNLLTFSKFKYWDPEQGGNAFAYPTQRVINFGIQMTIN